MADLITMQPNVNIDLFIVAPSNRRDKVMRELNRPTFSGYQLRLNERCKFISYKSIRQLKKDTSDYVGFMDVGVIHKIAEKAEPQ